MKLPQIDCNQALFLDDTPLMDVRAPVEFQQGSFPSAINLPLINNEERHSIGIRYSQKGQAKAIELGYELVKDDIKEHRVSDWVSFARKHPRGALYCFRGGMRSKICQQWLYDATGIVYPRINGGYKAMRRFLIAELEQSVLAINPLILSGRTGTGKTQLLQHLQQKVDLEDIYQHRGSAFGRHLNPQPSQIDIENKLSIVLLKHRNNDFLKMVLEDESTAIGSRRLPDNLVKLMKSSPVIVLETPIDARINIVFQEYIVKLLAEYQTAINDDLGFNMWKAHLSSALEKIHNRLGGSRYKEIKSCMDHAFIQQRNHNEIEHHKSWIYQLVVDYYDPMYDYQLNKKSDRIVFRGNEYEIIRHLDQIGIR